MLRAKKSSSIGKRHNLHSIAFMMAAIIVADTAHADPMPDAWITTQVKTQLLTTEGISGLAIHIDTIDGRVTLHGSVPTAIQKAKAEKIAAKVDGTTSVRNLLQVVSESKKKSTALADKVITDNVSAALKSDVALANSRITVRSVNKGVVLLEGTASNLSDHVRAIERVARIEGVRRVASEIKSPDRLGDNEISQDGIYDAKVSEKSTASDTWITTAVKLRLLANTDTPGFDINVETYGGVVTLFGIVDTNLTKSLAEAEAMKVDGTRKIQNELQVVAPSAQASVASKDSDVRDNVKRRLAANGQLSDSKIDVDVKNGVVRMTGTVAGQVDRLTALTLARATTGVRGLVDDLKVPTTKDMNK